jgi:hypothetical protein
MTRKDHIANLSDEEQIFEVLNELYYLILSFFNGDKEKTRNWFLSPNPLLNNCSPGEYIRQGKIDKLKIFINDQIDKHLNN